MLKCMKWEMRRIFYQLRWILLTAAVTGGICWVRYYDPAGALKGQFDSFFWILNVTVSCCAICLRLYPWYNMLQSFTGDAYIMGKIKKHFLCQAAVCKASRISLCAYAMLWSADDQGNDAVGKEP